jgi:CheY-like chemotaxis protein
MREALRGGSSQRILVVDDDVDTTEVMAAMFESMGYETRTATGGRDALRIVADFAPRPRRSRSGSVRPRWL